MCDNHADNAEAVAGAIEAGGGKAIAIQTHVTSEVTVDLAARHSGWIDTTICQAGTQDPPTDPKTTLATAALQRR